MVEEVYGRKGAGKRQEVAMQFFRFSVQAAGWACEWVLRRPPPPLYQPLPGLRRHTVSGTAAAAATIVVVAAVATSRYNRCRHRGRRLDGGLLGRNLPWGGRRQQIGLQRGDARRQGGGKGECLAGLDLRKDEVIARGYSGRRGRGIRVGFRTGPL